MKRWDAKLEHSEVKKDQENKELELKNIINEMNKGYMEYHIKLDVNVNNISFKNMHGSSLWIRKDIVSKLNFFLIRNIMLY